jgi:hypothetical protein
MSWNFSNLTLRSRKTVVLLSTLVLLIAAGVAIPRSFVVQGLTKLGLSSAYKASPTATMPINNMPTSNKYQIGSLNSQASRDPNAVNILTAAFQAMGGNAAIATINDSVIEANIERFGAQPGSGTLTAKIRGFSQVKTETKIGTDSFIYTLDKGQGWLSSNGKVADLAPEYSFIGRTDLLPLFGHFSRFLHTATNVELLGTTTIKDFPNPVYEIEIDEPGADLSESLMGVVGSGVFLLYIDTKTQLVNRVAYSIGAVDYPSSRAAVQFDYSDYRQVGAMLFPHRIAQTLDQQPAVNINVTSVKVNQGLNDQDFAKPAKN